MTRPSSSLGALVVLSLLGACRSEPGRSYRVRGEPRFTFFGAPLTEADGTPLPTTQDFVLHLPSARDEMLVAQPGFAARVPLLPRGLSAFEARGFVQLSLPFASCGATASYTSFQFTAEGARLTGRASGAADAEVGDELYRLAVETDLRGAADEAGPSFVAAPTLVDPLKMLRVMTTTPLPEEASASLIGPRGVVGLTAVRPEGGGVTVGFASSPGTALLYGAHYTWAVNSWTDLEGHPGPEPLGFDTLPPPPLLTDAGFETATADGGGAPIVSSSLVPAISGDKSLVLMPAFGLDGLNVAHSSRFTVRLKVASGAHAVKFNLREISDSDNVVWGRTPVGRAAWPGGESVVVPWPLLQEVPTPVSVSGRESPLWMGQTRALELPLPAGTDTEVVLDVAMEEGALLCGLSPPRPAYQVDDIRVE